MDENWDGASAALGLEGRGGQGGRDGSSRAGWEVSADGCCSSPASPRSWRPCWATRWCRWPVARPTSWQFPTNGKSLPGAEGIMVRRALPSQTGLLLSCSHVALLACSPLQMCQAGWVRTSCSCFTAYQGPRARGFAAFPGDKSQAGLSQAAPSMQWLVGVCSVCALQSAVSCCVPPARSAWAGHPGVP